MPQTVQCYNCGNYFTSSEITREHIPAQNLFNGYAPAYKTNRITVPGCDTCNKHYAKFDQVLRDAIGIMNDTNNLQSELTRQGVKSILRQRDGIKRISLGSAGRFDVKFNYSEFVHLHKKNFKAIFYKKFGLSINENEYTIQVICDGDDDNPEAMKILTSMYGFLTIDGNWSVSGHEEIFQYRLKAFKEEDNGTKVIESSNISDAVGIVGLMVYHKTLLGLVIAMKTDYMNQLATQKKQP